MAASAASSRSSASSDACIATHPSDMAVAMRVLDATSRP
jgi:CO/xanthine dehydrogenase FAD-binding subunit